jgi:ubiquinone/menaquinone biosynthesis C-methylase UbiE
MTLESRKQEEIAFHDKLRAGAHEQRWSPDAEHRVETDPLWSNFKYYAVERHSLELMRRWQLEHCQGATILDYCCGNGDEAIFVAQHGARKVHGIDISEVSINNCRERAAAAGLSDVARFDVMDAEAMDFPDATFDFIMEYGVLHHLELDQGMRELARVLKPGGHMICTETLGHNPFIRAYRRRTPHLRTAWETEHILKREQFEHMRRHFGKIEMHFFHLATLAAVPLRGTPLFEPAVSVLRVVDKALLSVPGLKWQAWQVLFRLSEPRHAA